MSKLKIILLLAVIVLLGSFSFVSAEDIAADENITDAEQTLLQNANTETQAAFAVIDEFMKSDRNYQYYILNPDNIIDNSPDSIIDKNSIKLYVENKARIQKGRFTESRKDIDKPVEKTIKFGEENIKVIEFISYFQLTKIEFVGKSKEILTNDPDIVYGINRLKKDPKTADILNDDDSYLFYIEKIYGSTHLADIFGVLYSAKLVNNVWQITFLDWLIVS